MWVENLQFIKIPANFEIEGLIKRKTRHLPNKLPYKRCKKRSWFVDTCVIFPFLSIQSILLPPAANRLFGQASNLSLRQGLSAQQEQPRATRITYLEQHTKIRSNAERKQTQIVCLPIGFGILKLMINKLPVRNKAHNIKAIYQPALTNALIKYTVGKTVAL